MWLAAGCRLDFRAPVRCSLARGTWGRSLVATHSAPASAVRGLRAEGGPVVQVLPGPVPGALK